MRTLIGQFVIVRRRLGLLFPGVVVMAAAPCLTSRGWLRPCDRKMRMVLQPVGRRVEAPDAKLSQRQQDSVNPHRSRKHRNCQECHVCRTNHFCRTYAMLGDIVCFRNRFFLGFAKQKCTLEDPPPSSSRWNGGVPTSGTELSGPFAGRTLPACHKLQEVSVFTGVRQIPVLQGGD